MKYEKLNENLIKAIGGKENIMSVCHCATRLRFQLANESKANDEAVNAIEGVLSVVKKGGQYQVVIGQNVADVYKELNVLLGNAEDAKIALKDAKEFKNDMKKKKISSRFIDVISGVFTPILGMLMATGVIKGVLAFLTATGLLQATSGTYQILSIVGDSFFFFLPVFLGYTAMKKFGGTPFIGMAIGAALVYPSLAVIMSGEVLYTLFTGTIFETPVYIEFLGIPVLLMNYASSVIPVIVTCFFAAKLEKVLHNKISDLFKTFAVPAITLLVSIVLMYLIIGPVASFASDILGAFFIQLFDFSKVLSGFLYGALIQVCVMFGIHWGFVAISVNNLATLGFDPITIAGLASAFGQAGIVLMIMLKTRNKKLKSVCGPAILSAMVGITEPSIYGVTLQFKKPFILGCIASGIGGAIIGLGNVKQYFYGTNGVFGWLQVINPETGFDASVVYAIVACVVSFVAAIILMQIFGKDSIKEIEEK